MRVRERDAVAAWCRTQLPLQARGLVAMLYGPARAIDDRGLLEGVILAEQAQAGFFDAAVFGTAACASGHEPPEAAAWIAERDSALRRVLWHAALGGLSVLADEAGRRLPDEARIFSDAAADWIRERAESGELLSGLAAWTEGA